jgi:hypothetical protein
MDRRATANFYDALGFLAFVQPQPFCHFIVQKAFAWPIGLHPFAIDDELGDSAFSRPPDNFFGGAGCAFDIDFLVVDVVALEEAPGLAAIATPES